MAVVVTAVIVVMRILFASAHRMPTLFFLLLPLPPV